MKCRDLVDANCGWDQQRLVRIDCEKLCLSRLGSAVIRSHDERARGTYAYSIPSEILSSLSQRATDYKPSLSPYPHLPSLSLSSASIWTNSIIPLVNITTRILPDLKTRPALTTMTTICNTRPNSLQHRLYNSHQTTICVRFFLKHTNNIHSNSSSTIITISPRSRTMPLHHLTHSLTSIHLIPTRLMTTLHPPKTNISDLHPLPVYPPPSTLPSNSNFFARRDAYENSTSK